MALTDNRLWRASITRSACSAKRGSTSDGKASQWKKQGSLYMSVNDNRDHFIDLFDGNAVCTFRYVCSVSAHDADVWARSATGDAYLPVVDEDS